MKGLPQKLLTQAINLKFLLMGDLLGSLLLGLDMPCASSIRKMKGGAIEDHCVHRFSNPILLGLLLFEIVGFFIGLFVVSKKFYV